MILHVTKSYSHDEISNLFSNFLRTIFNDDLYIKAFYCRINTNYDSLITNDMWINERYTLFYIIDASLHNDDVWITTTNVILLFINCQTFVKQFR